MKKKPSPIILNVKAEGFLITYTLQCEDRKGSMTELFTGKGPARCIDLGKVYSHMQLEIVTMYNIIPFRWRYKRNVLNR